MTFKCVSLFRFQMQEASRCMKALIWGSKSCSCTGSIDPALYLVLYKMLDQAITLIHHCGKWSIQVWQKIIIFSCFLCNWSISSLEAVMLKMNILCLTGIANGLAIHCSFCRGLWHFCIHSACNPQGTSARGNVPVSSESPGWSRMEQMCLLALEGKLLLAPKSQFWSQIHLTV